MLRLRRRLLLRRLVGVLRRIALGEVLQELVERDIVLRLLRWLRLGRRRLGRGWLRRRRWRRGLRLRRLHLGRRRWRRRWGWFRLRRLRLWRGRCRFRRFGYWRRGRRRRLWRLRFGLGLGCRFLDLRCLLWLVGRRRCLRHLRRMRLGRDIHELDNERRLLRQLPLEELRQAEYDREHHREVEHRRKYDATATRHEISASPSCRARIP